MSDGSYWTQAVQPKSKYSPLSETISADVVVIGGGITGITTAYLLSKSGKKVVLIDKGPLFSGETAYTTAFLTIYPDTELRSIKSKWDSEKVKWVLKSGEEAINLIEKISTEEKIECEFKRVTVFIYTQKKEDISHLKSESKIAIEAGYNFPFKTDSNLPVQNIGYLEVPNQAKFHPLKYLSKLSKIISENGVKIYEDTMVSRIDNTKDGVAVVTENGKTIKAKYAVMATHNTFGGPFLVQSELEQYNSYVLCVEITNRDLKENLYWDTEDPYNYIRIDKTKDARTILILGGADHKTGEEVKNAEEKYNQLENYLNNTLPGIEYKILYKWSGQVVETTDGLPFIGFLPEKKHVLVATGFAGNGMTFGTLSARIITDLVNGNENSLTELYALKRLKGIGELMKKGTNVMKEYGRKYLGKFESLDTESLKPDSGKVFAKDGKKVAAYKTKDGKLIKLSAVCTHLGCIVNWNDDQKSWDCPCHGSRYTNEGDVIGGPATKPLEKIK